ncbi:MAG: endonuclease III [Bacteroidales bacterium]|nr:endonuclease III [Bacteroidales bacterium]MDD4703194.1 endonuclease III [Bacteroidales bacterium]MDX9798022.1 endonuclease III [Bacteroidales bacterium]
MSQEERYKAVIDYFQKVRPTAESELNYNTPFELLVAVILSAQCTDVRVNMVTPELFKQYPTAKHLSKATPEEVFQIIKSVSYPNNKAKHLVLMAKKLVEKFNSQVPDNVEKLMELDGVGRKTANVVTSVIYNQPNMPVDTHVFRVSARIGLTKNAKTPLETEKQLVKNFPIKLIPIAHHWLILHGRYVCKAIKPKCLECGLREVCQYYSLKKD